MDKNQMGSAPADGRVPDTSKEKSLMTSIVSNDRVSVDTCNEDPKRMESVHILLDQNQMALVAIDGLVPGVLEEKSPMTSVISNDLVSVDTCNEDPNQMQSVLAGCVRDNGHTLLNQRQMQSVIADQNQMESAENRSAVLHESKEKSPMTSVICNDLVSVDTCNEDPNQMESVHILLDQNQMASVAIDGLVPGVLEGKENVWPKATRNKKPGTGGKSSRKLEPIEWCFLDQGAVNEYAWKKLQNKDKLNRGYGVFFKRFLEGNHGVTCKLKTVGFTATVKGLFFVRFICTMQCCKRQYKLKQVADNNFKIFHNNVNADHREVEKLKDSVEDFEVLNEFDFNKKLSQLINLPNNLLNEKKNNIEELELKVDKDNVYKMLEKKVVADREHKTDNKNDVFIRRFCLSPYIVYAFSNAQLQFLKSWSNESNDITVHFVASKSLVLNCGESMCYYAGVVAANHNVVTLMEIISEELEAFDVKILLDEYHNEMIKKYPKLNWPIKNCITDYNFEFISGVCNAWNRMTLITYINHTYSMLSQLLSISELNEFGIKTWLKFETVDVCKENWKDICKYFPKVDQSNKELLEKVFAAMCAFFNFSALKTVWKSLSTILLSKYLSDKVDTALKSLTFFIEEEKYVGNDEISYHYEKLPEDIHKYEEMYHHSQFYHHFNSMTYRKTVCFTVGSFNVFYCEEYAELFVKKYLSIISLWTGLVHKDFGSFVVRIEHLKTTAEKCNGPVSADVFLNRVEVMRKSATIAGVMQEGENQENEKELNGDVALPREDITIAAVMRIEQQDDRQENEGVAVSSSTTAALKNLERGKEQRNKGDPVSRKLTYQNKLFKDADLYFIPKVNFTVCCIHKLSLSSLDYNQLQEKSSIGIGLVEFVFALFQNETNKIQFEARNASIIVKNGASADQRIHKDIFIGALPEKNQFSLLIINCKKRIFIYIDPLTEHPPDTAIYFDNFKQYIVRHNQEYCRNKIPEDNWTIGHLNHQTEVDKCNSGLMILNFAQHYLQTERTDCQFDESEYRSELKHFILKNSDSMAVKCIICGSKVQTKKKSCTECSSCGRWTHLQCLDEMKDNNFCVICREVTEIIDEDFADSDNDVNVEC